MKRPPVQPPPVEAKVQKRGREGLAGHGGPDASAAHHYERRPSSTNERMEVEVLVPSDQWVRRIPLERTANARQDPVQAEKQ